MPRWNQFCVNSSVSAGQCSNDASDIEGARKLPSFDESRKLGNVSKWNTQESNYFDHSILKNLPKSHTSEIKKTTLRYKRSDFFPDTEFNNKLSEDQQQILILAGPIAFLCGSILFCCRRYVFKKSVGQHSSTIQNVWNVCLLVFMSACEIFIL